MTPTLTRWLVYGALALAVIALGWMDGYRRGELKLYDYQAKEAAATVAVVTKRGVVTERVITRYVNVAQGSKAVADKVEEGVRKYAESNAGMCLNDDWRRLHDAAAEGAVSEPARGPDGSVRAPGPDPGGAGDDRGERALDGHGELRAASSLR